MRDEIDVKIECVPSYTEGIIGTACLICDESVPLSDKEYLAMLAGRNVNPKVCDKCKAAVLRMREQMKEGGEV